MRRLPTLLFKNFGVSQTQIPNVPSLLFSESVPIRCILTLLFSEGFQTIKLPKEFSQNITIFLFQIDKSINDLVKNLRKMPPDLECLRVYLLLPEIALYEEPLNRYSYIADVGEKILELDTDAQRILCKRNLIIYLFVPGGK